VQFVNGESERCQIGGGGGVSNGTETTARPGQVGVRLLLLKTESTCCVMNSLFGNSQDTVFCTSDPTVR